MGGEGVGEEHADGAAADYEDGGCDFFHRRGDMVGKVWGIAVEYGVRVRGMLLRDRKYAWGRHWSVTD